MGVNAVSLDVWWGRVERAGDNRFDWDDYDRVVAAIEEADLDWVPILSFHQRGGNVGDSCDIPIPAWIWDHFQDQSVTKEALQYRSERDNASGEVVSIWQDGIVIPQYREFMKAFQSHFAAKAGMTEIRAGAAPAGSCRATTRSARGTGAISSTGTITLWSSTAVACWMPRSRPLPMARSRGRRSGSRWAEFTGR